MHGLRDMRGNDVGNNHANDAEEDEQATISGRDDLSVNADGPELGSYRYNCPIG